MTTEPDFVGATSDVNENPRKVAGHLSEETCGKYYWTPREGDHVKSEEH